MEEHLYHYYDESTGPFRNLSDMEPGEAEQVLADPKAVRQTPKLVSFLHLMEYLEHTMTRLHSVRYVRIKLQWG